MQYILNRSYCLDTNTNIDLEIDKIDLVIGNIPMFWFWFYYIVLMKTLCHVADDQQYLQMSCYHS